MNNTDMVDEIRATIIGQYMDTPTETDDDFESLLTRMQADYEKALTANGIDINKLPVEKRTFVSDLCVSAKSKPSWNH